mmetsp:Transcript_4648/g.8233  ORF Transcript_4648/g.8233 Transcript_4648/m.8233 type:complete len:145 (-) Transcript_4648:1168-1602(-)
MTDSRDQCLGYISQGILLSMFHALFGTVMSLDQFFSFSAVDAAAPTGWVIIMSTLLNAVVSAGVLCLVVERAKKCLDFTFTSHFVHLSACTMYEGFPSNWEWWMLNFASLVVMAVVGEYLCMRRELREIRISDFLSLRNPSSTN